MKLLPMKTTLYICFLLISMIFVEGCFSSGKHPRMPDIGPEIVPEVFSEASNILVLPLWRVIPRYYDETKEPPYLISSPFMARDLSCISSSMARPDYWSIVTPGSRIGNEFRMLRGIYLILKSGEVVWLSATLGYENWWSYIKWATMSKQWQNEIEMAIEKGKIWRSGESNSTFWGGDYKIEMRIEVKLTPDEKKMIRGYLDGIDYEKITNGGQWKLMFKYACKNNWHTFVKDGMFVAWKSA